ncbi:aminodeoxychorismate synthase component 1 [Siccibacter turicensis]|uniref:aminodeoxychorismate synthase component 1 n=1 Tax=Siccibacter turicensis TaxID=357233 RepID=UPI00046452A0|nr:aminodeoxychorismate synthase component 1 [Siccibacter turicensis]
MSDVTPHPLSLLPLPWEADAAERYFAPLAHQPWAMLLHSGHADHPHSRFDMLVADPLITLQTQGEITHIDSAQGGQTSRADPLTLLHDRLESLGWQSEPDEALPFTGGAMGLFGYDLGRRFETLPQRAEADVQAPDMAVGIYDWALIVDNQLQKVTLVSHGDAGARLAWLNAQPRAERPTLRLTTPWEANMTRAEYGEKFRQVQAWLASGDCYQVNLAQRFAAQYTGDEWQAFVTLNAQNRAPFSAFLRLPQHAILSLSPERFIHLARGQIATRPIKGTLPRLADADADARQAQRLAQSPKDRAENLMIVDLMRNDIGRVAAPGSVRVPELFVVEPFPAVHHLVSTITGTLPDRLHATDLLRACFPGGSITGAPKVRAMEIIETLEPQRRNAWCGSIGYISACGTMDTSITIRTLTAQAGTLYCSAGGGIVADSEEQAEYQETFDKVNRILRNLEP